MSFWRRSVEVNWEHKRHVGYSGTAELTKGENTASKIVSWILVVFIVAIMLFSKRLPTVVIAVSIVGLVVFAWIFMLILMFRHRHELFKKENKYDYVSHGFINEDIDESSDF